MKHTPEQRKQVDAARAAGEGNVMLEFTPEQRTDWQAARDQALSEKDQVIADFRRMCEAEAEETFSGHLRRAIRASRQSPQALANRVGIDERLLADFRCGERTLPSDVIDRLIAALGLRLMQEISLSNSNSAQTAPETGGPSA